MKTIFTALILGAISAQAQVDATIRQVQQAKPLLAPYELPARYVLSGATVHPVSAPSIANGKVFVVDGKIREVGKNVESFGAEEIDLTGLHLYPGLISASGPLGLIEIGAVRATRDSTEVGSFTPDVNAWLAVNPDSELIPVARAGGVLYSLATPAGGTVAGQSGLMQLAGWGIEEMTFAKPVALHVNWPSMRLRLAPKESLSDPKKWKSPEDQDNERRERIEDLTRFFHDARAYAKAKVTAKSAVDFVEIPAMEAMIPYVSGHSKVYINADGKRQISAAVDWAETNDLNIIICGGQDAWMVADRLAKRKVPVVYEHVLERPARDADDYDQPFRNPAILTEKGVSVAISLGRGRFSAFMARNLPHAAAHAARHGLSQADAVRSVTLMPAQILGVEDRLGSLEAGKQASMVALDGPLLDVRSKVRRVWVSGEEISPSSRHTKLYQRYQKRPKR
ncbi:MAG: amidohydrolase family protein [Limisphaerales bacterium]